MMLPKLNDTPKYNTIIPSTGKSVRFRPYLVKEEKVLSLAVESRDSKSVLDAVADTVVACIQDDVPKNTLTSFDIEYLFLQIRAKSVGEKIDLNIKCSKCGVDNDVILDINEITIDTPKKSKSEIKLNDSISIKLRWPSYFEMTDNKEMIASKSSVDFKFNYALSCIDVIKTEDEAISTKDVPYDEMVEFLESFNAVQYQKIEDFINTMPKMEHEIKFTCVSCSTDNSLTLNEAMDFF